MYYGSYPKNNGTMTGTSSSTSILVGACALMLQWGMVQGNDIGFNTHRIRTFLIKGGERDHNITYPNHQWGYGRLNLVNTFRHMI
ncbi:MAG: hypothetical protein FWC68_01220 [Oscillospiraceae bacterium]|nr:hypothetical protein [Oscillospiraceae bacterium]